MYVQKVPTPIELKEDFDKIDKWVARRIFESLNKTKWEANGACHLWQVYISFVSTWWNDCRGTLHYNSTKELLQRWVEGHSRDKTQTWWGFQREEMEHWVFPYLSMSNNYWIKYQYTATVYSKEHDMHMIWKLECTTNEPCTVSLAIRPCTELPGWESYCESFYKNVHDTHVAEVPW